ncbi:hypothetical protein [Nitrospirillum bahiense]|uniref:hypothetical protein n=1 Tax=Nitrospirillum amazonense TaxID=28077 RepID=UPI00119EA862|nr:hypothetical protein [Nitrospirillum amazonense]
MIDINSPSAQNAMTVVAVAIAVAMAVWMAVAQYGWLEGVVRHPALFWGTVLGWAISVINVIRWRRRWWLLATAPIVLFPVIGTVMLAIECGRGNCL